MRGVNSISNRAMRRLFLERQGLSSPARPRFDKRDLLQLVEQLAYVQVDSINVVERAHHLILFARDRRYRREMLDELLEADHQLFEHWTHDACILPASYYPHWQHRFDVARKRLAEPRWRKRLGPRPQRVLNEVRRRIEREGPLRTRDFSNGGGVKRDSWWGWTHEKTALEFLWRTGELGISRRDGFEKVYDRMEEVVPVRHRNKKIDWEESLDWKCREALKRLGAATAVELAGFWSSFSTRTVKQWLASELAAGRVIEVAVETADGSRSRPRAALPECLEHLATAPAASRSMRLLSPFDPLIRDRKRTAWLFGFDYRIEVFVPAAKREYGYYVLPILEGDRLTGRIDLKTHRKQGFLEVKGLWWEPGTRVTPARLEALHGCLGRLANFVGVDEVRGLEQKRARSRRG
ncbi:MAG: YcaQ family DNA glycosylase [Deltaproteobacteria bacterium]|nr:YcaQ family DNA glycosylase [Deltaproteobacteria bacterium]